MKKRSSRFYFSFRSPYSWIAARLLEERLPTVCGQLEYIPFWEPDAITLELLHARGGEFLYTPMSRQKHLYILQDIKRLTRKLGYENKWPIDVNPWWELPHLAYLKARQLHKGPEAFWAIYRARWERAENICSEPVIRRVADEIGLDGDLLVGAPSDPEIRAEGVDALYSCYKDDVFGIPFFIHGYEKFWGVDRFEDFAACIQGGSREGQECQSGFGVTSC